jgi:2-methylcitrate dehydratase PrpD
MSIHYCVAATLAQGKLAESNYHLLDDPEVMRLVGVMTLEAGDDFTASYPGRQGAEVTVTLRNGERRTSLLEDVVPASPDEIRRRFRSVCKSAGAIESFIDDLEHREDAGALCKLMERD